MYTLISSMPLRQLLIEQAPVFLASFIIAELFYKFHSFTLECGAFLVTWFVLDVAARLVTGQFGKSREKGNITN